jgi:transposase, IS5 family
MLDGERVVPELVSGVRSAATRRGRRLAERSRAQIEATLPLLRRVTAQTRVRIFKGDIHYRVSLFEPHTEAIRKGKTSKPTEFGMVKIQEAENQVVVDYQV